MTRVSFSLHLIPPSLRKASVRLVSYLLVCTLMAFLCSCARQPEPSSFGDVPGFVLGLVHGFVMIISFIGSFFMDVRMYAFPNSGKLYDLGFMIGACCQPGALFSVLFIAIVFD